jgi:PPOX class probable F420-dependent enzyme
MENEAHSQHAARHDPALGKPKGEPVEAVARVLPKDETRAVYNAIIKRYWWHAWWFVAHSVLRGGIDNVHIGIEVKPA